MTDYKPGTVATGKVGAREGTLLRAVDGWYFVGPFGSGTDSGWRRDSTGLVTDVRPLVTLDLNSLTFTTESVVSMLRAAYTDRSVQAGVMEILVEQIQAQTKPPKPTEPTGLGAVVQDAKGTRWVRVTVNGASDCWKPNNARDKRRVYAEVDAVRVLSEGVDA